MAYSMALNSIYNQYLTTYAPKKSDSRYDTHKKSELRGITNSMAKVNKDAPLYKIDRSPDTNEYIIGIKEESRLLQNTIASVVGDAESASLDGKIAYSSNENIASAVYIGQDMDTSEENPDGIESVEKEIPTYEIEVQSLAESQVNMGRFLPKDEMGLPATDYKFDLSVNDQGYEFQYSIREGDTNFDVQNRLSRLINNSNIGLKASVEEDGEGNSSLRIESERVGIRLGEKTKVFNIADSGEGFGNNSVDYLGINHVVREASNARFTINGEEAEASSNSFVLEKEFEITLNGVSPEEGIKATIGVKPDTEAALENINNLIGGYNQFIRAMARYNESQAGSSHLVREMRGIAGLYSEQMSKLGITTNREGTMDVDNDKLEKAILSEDMETTVSSLKQFSGAMVRKSREVSLNPVSYLNKTVVEYKNPGKNFSSPYVASAYAGMMFNSYC